MLRTGPDGRLKVSEHLRSAWALRLLPVALCVTLGTAAAPAAADPLVYEYRVAHPLYGDIGTYTNVVRQTGDSVDVETKLHIVVKLLGLVVHRQEAERREHWIGDRLTLFCSVPRTTCVPSGSVIF